MKTSTALPIASCISLEEEIPMILLRKEGPKDYGTKKVLEGEYEKGLYILRNSFSNLYFSGQRCLVIEDVITTGESVLNVVRSLRSEGLTVKDVIVFVDREQGARGKLESFGLKIHSIFSLSHIANFFHIDFSFFPKPYEKRFSQRSDDATNSIAKYLFRLMDEKKTNLALAADFTLKEGKEDDFSLHFSHLQRY